MRDGAYSFYCFVDNFTWPHALRVYAASDLDHFAQIINFDFSKLPFSPAEDKIKVLCAITSAVLDSEIIREYLSRPRKEHTDEETCRSCQFKGELILCDSCPAGYHQKCAHLDVESDDIKLDTFLFECPVCIQNKISSVSDCISSFEKDPIRYVRHRTLGHDRHGRRYWLLARRLWVEESGQKCWYYSTPEQLQEVLDILDPADYEAPLCKSIDDYKGEIMNQMAITIKETRDSKPSHPIRRQKPVNYLDLITQEYYQDTDMLTAPPASDQQLPEVFTQFQDIEKYFRLGLEGRFREYRNFYQDNRLTLTKKEIKEAKDMDRSLYAIEYDRAFDRQKYVRPESISHFLWTNGGNLNGSRESLISIIAQSMLKVHDGIKLWFFHPGWKKKRVDWRTNMDKFAFLGQNDYFDLSSNLTLHE